MTTAYEEYEQKLKERAKSRSTSKTSLWLVMSLCGNAILGFTVILLLSESHSEPIATRSALPTVPPPLSTDPASPPPAVSSPMTAEFKDTLFSLQPASAGNWTLAWDKDPIDGETVTASLGGDDYDLKSKETESDNDVKLFHLFIRQSKGKEAEIYFNTVSEASDWRFNVDYPVTLRIGESKIVTWACHSGSNDSMFFDNAPDLIGLLGAQDGLLIRYVAKDGRTMTVTFSLKGIRDLVN